MKVIIVYNSKKEKGESIALRASEILNDKSVATEVYEFDSPDFNYTPDKAFNNADAVVAIGGDGTIIKVAKTAAVSDVPVIGINAGRLGYLASIDPGRLELLSKLTDNDYSIDERIMLHAEKFENGICTDVCDCLNDAVISRASLSNMLDIKATVGADVLTYRADGFIAATPTGSTAYSMSAGGPVVDPSLNCMILTPVCPHTLFNRSMVVDAKTPVTVEIDSADEGILLSSDGREAFKLSNNSIVKISQSELRAKLIKINDISVYKIFSEKTTI